MKDPADNKTRNLLGNTDARRQAAYRNRKIAQGYKRSNVWIHQGDYDAGYQAAQLGSTNASDCPAGRDRLSWTLGYCAELDRAAAAQAAHQEPVHDHQQA